MKTTMILVGLLASASLHAAVIQQVIVRQQWPWSTDVKVEYKLAEVTAPVDISVKAFNGDTELPLPASAITGDLYGISESGIGQFIIDPVKAFGNTKVAIADFRVELELSESAAQTTEVLYRIYDMSDTTKSPYPYEDIRRADFLNGKYGSYETSFAGVSSGYATSLGDVFIWTGVTNYPEAKTTKLVLRRVPAKNVTWRMGASGGSIGDNNASEPHDCTLTNDYFIGVFELTQEQYRRLARNSYTGSSFPGDANPVNAAMLSVFRSGITEKNAVNFSGGFELDFPTEAQWEYACRAGTTAELYTGQWLSTVNLDPIAWDSANSGSVAHEVGLKLPNAFGLYDMIGNVYEACSDNWSDAKPAGYADGAAVTDPTGNPAPDESSRLVIRGGCFSVNNFYCTSAGRNKGNGGWNACGFRVCGRLFE